MSIPGTYICHQLGQNENFTVTLESGDKHVEKKIDKYLFLRYSEKFQNDLSFIQSDQYKVTSEVKEEGFNCFFDACQGLPYCLSKETIFDFSTLCDEFQVTSFKEERENYILTHKLALETLLLRKNENRDQMIKAIAENFTAYANEEDFIDKILKLDKSIIEDIFSGVNQNNDVSQILYETACKMFDEDQENKTCDLLTKIKLENLTSKSLSNLLTNYSEKIPDSIEKKWILPVLKKSIDVDSKINDLKSKLEEHTKFLIKLNDFDKKLNDFKSIKNDLDEISQKTVEFKKLRYNLCTFFDPFHSGIFFNWWKVHKNNPVDGGLVKIITPEEPEEKFSKKNLLEYEPSKLDSCYYLKITDTKADNSFYFDFGDKKVSLIGFCIRTNSFGETIAHPSSFTIEGSDDENKWETIEEYKDFQVTELNGSRRHKVFIFDKQTKMFQFIRYTQHDTFYRYTDSDRIISLSAFELYGDLNS